MKGKIRQIRSKVAVFIDVENVCALDMGWIMRAAKRLGHLEIARGYGNFANWRFLSPAAERLFQLGVKLVHAPAWMNGSGRWKDAADEIMICDMSEVLIQRPDVVRFIVCTGDAHFLPSICEAQSKGREVIVIGPEKISRFLIGAVDRCLIAPPSGIDLPLGGEPPSFEDPNGRQAAAAAVRVQGASRNGDRLQERYEVNAPPLAKPGTSTTRVAA